MNPHPPKLPQTPDKSSHLTTVGYDPVTQSLDVVFKSGGPTYRYHGVPPQIHTSLVGAQSKGKFFSTAIKGHFRHTQLPS